MSREASRDVRQLVERLEMNLLGVVLTGTTKTAGYYYGHEETRPATPRVSAKPIAIRASRSPGPAARARARRPAR